MPEIRALTLHQPWASLVAWGVKHYETRPRPLSYRGPLAIHAADPFRLRVPLVKHSYHVMQALLS